MTEGHMWCQCQAGPIFLLSKVPGSSLVLYTSYYTHSSWSFLPWYSGFHFFSLPFSVFFLFTYMLLWPVLWPRLHFASYPQSLPADGSVEVISQGWKEKKEGTLCICVTPPPLHLFPNLRAPVLGNVKSSHLPPHPKAIIPSELHLYSHDGI